MKHELVVLDHTGDSRVTWDTEDTLSIERANAQFDRLIGQGYRGVRMDTPESGEVVKGFDPESDLTMVPNIHAG